MQKPLKNSITLKEKEKKKSTQKTLYVWLKTHSVSQTNWKKQTKGYSP